MGLPSAAAGGLQVLLSGEILPEMILFPLTSP